MKNIENKRIFLDPNNPPDDTSPHYLDAWFAKTTNANGEVSYVFTPEELGAHFTPYPYPPEPTSLVLPPATHPQSRSTRPSPDQHADRENFLDVPLNQPKSSEASRKKGNRQINVSELGRIIPQVYFYTRLSSTSLHLESTPNKDKTSNTQRLLKKTHSLGLGLLHTQSPEAIQRKFPTITLSEALLIEDLFYTFKSSPASIDYYSLCTHFLIQLSQLSDSPKWIKQVGSDVTALDHNASLAHYLTTQPTIPHNRSFFGTTTRLKIPKNPLVFSQSLDAVFQSADELTVFNAKQKNPLFFRASHLFLSPEKIALYEEINRRQSHLQLLAGASLCKTNNLSNKAITRNYRNRGFIDLTMKLPTDQTYTLINVFPESTTQSGVVFRSEQQNFTAQELNDTLEWSSEFAATYANISKADLDRAGQGIRQYRLGEDWN